VGGALVTSVLVVHTAVVHPDLPLLGEPHLLTGGDDAGLV